VPQGHVARYCQVGNGVIETTSQAIVLMIFNGNHPVADIVNNAVCAVSVVASAVAPAQWSPYITRYNRVEGN